MASGQKDIRRILERSYGSLLKAQKTPLRSTFTKTLNQLKEACENANPDKDQLEALIEQLSEKGRKLEK